MSYDPVVKWSGSKRSQAEEIIRRFPTDIDTYYEPFCGGCSVLFRLLQTNSIKVKRYVACDLNGDLIALWNEIKQNPDRLCTEYNRMWEGFNLHDDPNDRFTCFSERKDYFYDVRDRLNKEHRPSDFLFIMRTTTNGMPRYNDKGEFNNSCHFSRPGILPHRLRRICRDWSSLLNAKCVEFLNCSYEEVSPSDGDLTYLDPPYANTKGMYYGGIDLSKYFGWLSSIHGRWVMSFDGRRGDTDNTYIVPQELYSVHDYLKSGNSSFVRYLGKGNVEEVQESLYLNYIPTDRQTEPQISTIQMSLF